MIENLSEREKQMSKQEVLIDLDEAEDELESLEKQAAAYKFIKVEPVMMEFTNFHIAEKKKHIERLKKILEIKT